MCISKMFFCEKTHSHYSPYGFEINFNKIDCSIRINLKATCIAFFLFRIALFVFVFILERDIGILKAQS